MSSHRPSGPTLGLLLFCFATPFPASAQPPVFTDVTATAGLGAFRHGNSDAASPIEPRWISAGVACGDIDGDGDLDLYLVGGDQFANRLYRNNGDGTFTDVAATAGVQITGVVGSAPVLTDVDGDGDLDLFVFSVQGAPIVPTDPPVADPAALPRLFLNNGSGVFVDGSASTGIESYAPVYSAALGDIDRDGDLDLFLSHWMQGGPMLWENEGGGTYTAIDATHLGADTRTLLPNTFTPAFADLDSDGWPDLAVASDFGQSRQFANRGDGTFARRNATVLTDENGMGASVGDVDNDGDLDWFVSSIWDPDGVGGWGVSGNRLYRNDGSGNLTDATTAAGVRQGYWGWGACFADFDLDGDLDLVHTNGFPAAPASEFWSDPTRLFLNDGLGAFAESAAAAGLADSGQGRAVVCFDFDGDGDLDLLVMQNGNLRNGYAAPVRLFRNTPPAGRHWLKVRPIGRGANSQAVGARVVAQAGALTQMRELRLGSNFAAHDPVEAHFGLGAATTVDLLRVVWPDGTEVAWSNVAADQTLQPSSATACSCSPRLVSAVAGGPIAWNVACETSGTPLASLPLAWSVVAGPNSGLTGNGTTSIGGSATLGFTGHGSPGRDRVRVTATSGGLALACTVDLDWTSLFEDSFETGGLTRWSAH